MSSNDGLERRFAITVDLRLVPTTKVKPDTGSPFHGIELATAAPMPLAWVLTEGVKTYRLIKDRDEARLAPGERPPLLATVTRHRRPATRPRHPDRRLCDVCMPGPVRYRPASFPSWPAHKMRPASAPTSLPLLLSLHPHTPFSSWPTPWPLAVRLRPWGRDDDAPQAVGGVGV